MMRCDDDDDDDDAADCSVLILVCLLFVLTFVPCAIVMLFICQLVFIYDQFTSKQAAIQL